MGNSTILDLDHTQRFGAEIELNSSDRRDYKENPLDTFSKELPVGIEYIAQKVLEISDIKKINISEWHHTHNNDLWIIKPDSSCGVEVCTPVLKGLYGVEEVGKIVHAFGKDPKIFIDDRCSMHVHVDVSRILEHVPAMIAWWIKCEMVFFSAMPHQRKCSRYCTMIGQSDLFEHDEQLIDITLLGEHKYTSLNTFHLTKNKRKSIEFRLPESKACEDSKIARNWIKLILHFVYCSIRRGFPKPYQKGNPMSGLVWMNPLDVFRFLGFGHEELSSELEETRCWLINRLEIYNTNVNLLGIWEPLVREIVQKEVKQL